MKFRTVNVLLDSGYECANVVSDTLQLEDVGLLNEELEAEETINPDTLQLDGEQGLAIDDETNSYTSSETSQQSVCPTSEETEAVRKHIEECFQLTDTISEQTRRICGKDYNQFRASQLQRLRFGPNQMSEIYVPPGKPIKNESCNLTLASFPTLGEQSVNEIHPQTEMTDTTDAEAIGLDLLLSSHAVSPPLSEEEVKMDGGAMISMTFDQSFIEQLVNLFGVPDLQTKKPSSNNQLNVFNFDIPWSLAEQLYLHWCSSLISKDQETSAIVNDDQKGFQNIMDFELAMQLVQDEV